MAVTLIAVVAALVIGHLAPAFASAVRHYDWYGRWLDWLDAQFSGEGAWRGRWGIVLALVPALLVVGLFQIALDAPLWGIAGLVFAVAVLFYAWGPRDLDVDVDAIVDAPNHGARREAVARLWPDGTTPAVEGGLPSSSALVTAVFHNALRRWFGVLFWFLLLGPFGAMLYRLTALACEGPLSRKVPGETGQGARTLLALLEWPVAQLMTLALALVGNFDAVLGAWRENGGATLSLDHRFLEAAARASVRTELAEEAADYASEYESGLGEPAAVSAPVPGVLQDLPELRDAMSLVWRILLVWLAVLALFVVAGFVA